MTTATGLDAIAAFRGLFETAHGFLEGTMADVTVEQVRWVPPGTASTIGANYVHVLASEDLTIQGLLRGSAPLASSDWAGRMGVSEPPPMGPGHDLRAWGTRAMLDLETLRPYAQAVYAATDAYLASLAPEDLGRTFDLSQFGFGQQPMTFLLTNLLLNCALHSGEISCLKGMQGAKGYPA
jgi:hypothetical protein